MNASSCPILDCLLDGLFFLLFYEIVNKKVPCRYTMSFQCRCDVVRCMNVETTSCVYRVKLINLTVRQATEKFKKFAKAG